MANSLVDQIKDAVVRLIVVKLKQTQSQTGEQRRAALMARRTLGDGKLTEQHFPKPLMTWLASIVLNTIDKDTLHVRSCNVAPSDTTIKDFTKLTYIDAKMDGCEWSGSKMQEALATRWPKIERGLKKGLDEDDDLVPCIGSYGIAIRS